MVTKFHLYRGTSTSEPILLFHFLTADVG